MRLVEVIPGLKTAQWVTDAMMALGRRMTREPVLCTDSPAFLVNHVGRGFVPESQRILTESIASRRRHRPHPHRRARLQDGAVRAGRHGRHRHPAQRDGVDLRPVLRRAGVRAHEPLRPARRRRAAGPQDRRRLVHLRQRQGGHAAAAAGAHGAAEVGVGAAERAPPRAAGAADRPLQAGRRDAGDDGQAQRRRADRAHAHRLGRDHRLASISSSMPSAPSPSTCCSA